MEKIVTSATPLSDLILSRMKTLGIDKIEQFADFSGIGRTTAYDLINGRSNRVSSVGDGEGIAPSLATFFKLERFLNTPISDLIELFRPKNVNDYHIDYAVFIGEYPLAQSGFEFQKELRGEE